jgi:hypothetical protein
MVFYHTSRGLGKNDGGDLTLALRSPPLVILDALANAERRNLADQGQRQRLLQQELDGSFSRGEFCEFLSKGFRCRGRWEEPDVTFEGGEQNQNPFV